WIHRLSMNAMPVTQRHDMNGLPISHHYARLTTESAAARNAGGGRESMSVQHPDMAMRGTDPARLLDELKRVCVEQLGEVPGGLYRPVEDYLHEALRVGSDASHRKDLMALLALRQRA